RQPDDQRERGGDGGELDAERHGGPEHAHRHLDQIGRAPCREKRGGAGGDGGHDRGEQSHEPVGHRGYGGQYATIGDREGREREPGGADGGDVRGESGQRDDRGRQPDDQRERGGDGGELDAERHGGPEHAHRHLDRLERQPRDLQRDGDGGHGGHDYGE